MTELGYNFKLKIGDKTFIGVTQDDFSLSAIVKESITKDNAGAKQKEVVGHDGTFKVAGVLGYDTSTGSTKLDSDDILDLALATGSSAVLTYTYVRSSGKAKTGSCIITNYSESTPADGESDSTYTLDIATMGAISDVTNGSN